MPSPPFNFDTQTPERWDIFCAVVDNLGDAGVCWRLARQLANESGMQVRLWIDDLDTLALLLPAATDAQQQVLEAVEIRRWQRDHPFGQETVADVVIEAFACTLPPSYVRAMAARAARAGRAPRWFNLEYLTAEAFATDCHGLPSIEPTLGLTKHFFFPGFNSATGGLVRERDLVEQRNAWQSSAGSGRLLQQLGVPVQDAALRVSLFCYENAPVASLLSAWSSGAEPVQVLVTSGGALTAVNTWLERALLPGQPQTRGALRLYAIPFLSQREYDQLLWSCDLNFVRGEDSLVRALWAGKPLLWQLYPQEDDARLPKLDAFFALYTKGLPAPALAAADALWSSWNTGGEAGRAWPAFRACWPALQAHALDFSAGQIEHPDLASNLVLFSTKLI